MRTRTVTNVPAGSEVDESRGARRERLVARFGEPAEQDDTGHGRRERRWCRACADPELVEPLSGSRKGSKSLMVIDSEHSVGDEERTLDRHWDISG